MARDWKSIITTLLNSSGRSPEEAKLCLAKAEELSKAHGIDLAHCRPDTTVRRHTRTEDPSPFGHFKWAMHLSVQDICVTLLKRNRGLHKREQWSHDKIARFVRHVRPGAKTSAASVGWYASKLKKGEIL